MLKEILQSIDIELGTLETKISTILEGNGSRLGFDYKSDIKKISDDLSLYDLKLGNYLLESGSKDNLDNLEENLEKNGTKVKGEFEYNNKKYLILERPKINGEVEIELDETNGRVIDIL